MRTTIKRFSRAAAIAIPIGIAFSFLPTPISRAETIPPTSTQKSIAQTSPESMSPFSLNQRAMTVIGQGLSTAPADTARLELSLGLRVPANPSGEAEMNPSPEELLEPLITVLTANGISRERIQIQAVQIENPRVFITVDRPNRESLQTLISQINQSLRSSQALFLQSIGAEYAINNCQFLERRARQAALNDAQTRATNLATDLRVKRGALLQVTEYPISGSPASGACGSKVGVAVSSPFSPASDNLPPYNPGAPTEVQLRSQVSITYTIEDLAAPDGV